MSSKQTYSCKPSKTIWNFLIFQILIPKQRVVTWGQLRSSQTFDDMALLAPFQNSSYVSSAPNFALFLFLPVFLNVPSVTFLDQFKIAPKFRDAILHVIASVKGLNWNPFFASSSIVMQNSQAESAYRRSTSPIWRVSSYFIALLMWRHP